VGPTATPTPTPTPTPMPTATNSSSRPAASGDAFAYAGEMTETFVRPPIPNGGITPVPNPTDTETFTTAVTQTVSVSQPAASQYDFHVVETDVLDGGLETSTVTSDELYDYLTSGSSTDVSLAAISSVDSSGATEKETFGSGNGLVDILPETAGQILPANNAAVSTLEKDPDGSKLSQAVAADGSYTLNGSDPIGVPIRGFLYASGQGKYTFPLLEPADSDYTVSAPTPGPKGSPRITLFLTVPANLVGDPNPGDPPVTIPLGSIRAWYPVPLVLHQQTQTNDGATALPSACDVPAALNRTPNKIVATTTTIDPVFGETDDNTTTTYTEPGIGVACVELKDVVKQYYDLSDQTQIFSQGTLGFQATPFQITTTTETLGLTSETVLGTSSTGRLPQAAGARAASQLAVRAGIAHFRQVLAKHRFERRREFASALEARVKGVQH
jgi:hypothetical protein